MRRLCANRGETTNLDDLGKRLCGDHAHAYVGGLGRMRQETDRNKIDTRLRISTYIFQSNPTRAFDGDAAIRFRRVGLRASLHGSADVFGRHIVEENGFGAGSQRLFEFPHGAYFDFDWLRTPAVAVRSLQRRNESAGQGDVVVLDEHTVGKIEAVILASAATYRILVDGAQPGRGFASVENSCASSGDGLDELSREGCDAAHTLQKIEDHALAGKDHARVVPDDRDGLARV